MNGLWALLLLFGLASQDSGMLVEVSHCGMMGCVWSITVSQDGGVTVEDYRSPHKGMRYALSRSDLVRLKTDLEREKPLELSGRLGDLMFDGPERSVRVTLGGRSSSFQILGTPPGFAQVYRTDPSGLGRALRVCEAVRRLGAADLASCVDVH